MAFSVARSFGSGVVSLTVALALGTVATAAAADEPKPSSPSSPSPSSSPSPDADVRRGLVAIERDGRIAGVGVVLGTDGRVLTSLSALGGDDVTVKLPDGRSVKAHVGHRDKASDLALLVLQSGKWTEGLRASEVDPSQVELRAVASTQAGRATTVPITLKKRADVRSKDGQQPLSGALELELPKNANVLAGAPVLDEKGSVMGIFVRACRPAPTANTFTLAPTHADAGAGQTKCTPGWVGAPVAWIRAFLVKTPLEAVAPSPWLGIAGEPGTAGSTSGVRILAVAPQSPAEKAGLKGSSDRAKSHLIVAVDGSPVATPEKLAEVIGQHAVGDAVKVLVLDNDKLKEITVTLKAAP